MDRGDSYDWKKNLLTFGVGGLFGLDPLQSALLSPAIQSTLKKRSSDRNAGTNAAPSLSPYTSAIGRGVLYDAGVGSDRFAEKMGIGNATKVNTGGLMNGGLPVPQGATQGQMLASATAPTVSDMGLDAINEAGTKALSEAGTEITDGEAEGALGKAAPYIMAYQMLKANKEAEDAKRMQENARAVQEGNALRQNIQSNASRIPISNSTSGNMPSIGGQDSYLQRLAALRAQYGGFR